MKAAISDTAPNRPAPIVGEALRRLISEVAAPSDIVASGYNRTYNRHNR